VRAATTVKKDDGTSAVGTALDANSPAIAKLNNGEAYYGGATIFGKTYAPGYEPINHRVIFFDRTDQHSSSHDRPAARERNQALIGVLV
jgi:hypothetical protein